MTDAERRAVPVAAGTSHAVFLGTGGDGVVSLRFFTAAGELPACGHGTVAALAVLADRADARAYETVLRSGDRSFLGRATRSAGCYEATFDPGPVELRKPTPAERAAVLPALGIRAGAPSRVASVGRPRLLVQVPDRAALAELVPDLTRLREACERLGLLGCYVFSTPDGGGRAAARMFAPSIGVPEDIANANSTACLAAHLAEHRGSALTVDMGDALGEPSTVIATARTGRNGTLVRVGGTAGITGRLALG